MPRDTRIPLFDLLSSLSDTADLICPAVANHHLQVAYIAYCLGTEMSLSPNDLRTQMIAGALHDVGAFSSQERIDIQRFEVENPFQHCRAGYWLLQTFPPFRPAAELVRFHHLSWESGRGAFSNGQAVPLGSHILHLADRVAVLVSEENLVLPHVKRIRARIRLETAKRFHPDVVDMFERVARREQFWLDASSRSILTVMRHRIPMDDIVLDTAGLLQFAEFFRRLIDFRSPFTACHSSGVAAIAESLAQLTGFSDDDVKRMRVASYLHDLGKLAIPQEIIDKPARLSPEEYAVMEGHVYYTYRILESITDLRTIREWSAFHQERMDGSGYPFHLTGEDLSLGARILAVADVFTAITENRPYRKGMDSDQAIHVLDTMVERNELDPEVVKLAKENVDELNSKRISAQAGSHDEYQQFLAAIA